MPQVDVVVPAFNSSGSIAATLRCLEAQDYGGIIRVVVVDDGSSDDTAEVVRRIAPWSTLVRSHNAGPSSARNMGLARCSGQFVLFLDADDVVPRDYVSTLTDAAESAAADVVVAGWVEVTPDGDLLGEQPPPSLRVSLLDDLLPANAAAIHCFLVRRTLLTEVAGFDEQLRQHEDWDLWLRVAARSPRVVRVDAARAVYVRVPNSNSASNEGMEFTRAVVLARAQRLAPQSERDQARRRARQAAESYIGHFVLHPLRSEGVRRSLPTVAGRLRRRLPVLPSLTLAFMRMACRKAGRLMRLLPARSEAI
jgi:glycosyltransferase involved in cell wall biosynthesis